MIEIYAQRDIDWRIVVVGALCGYGPIIAWAVADIIRHHVENWRIVNDVRRHRRPIAHG